MKTLTFKKTGSRTVKFLRAAFAVCALLVWFSAGTSLYAQSFKATLVGQITDQNGAAVPGATVTVTQQGTNQTQTATTGDDGSYTIAQLAPGAYELRIEAQNFRTIVQSDLILETNQTQRVNLTLQAGSVTETINVTAEVPVVNTDTSSKGEVITPRQVQDLPLNGRDFTDLALLTPGVYRRPADDDQGEGLATAGTRTDSTNFILDGVNNRSDRNGNVGVNTSVDSIREFSVSTSTYTAEFGRTAGAQINVVSKSGTNRFSGTLFEFVRNDYFDAANFFSGEKKLRRNQFGGTLGGPLPFLNFGEGGPVFSSGKDRTFFFVSYERTIERRSEASLNTAPRADFFRGDFSSLLVGRDGILGTADDNVRNSADTVDNRIRNPFAAGRPFFTNNIIPQELFSPIARQILPFIPAANDPTDPDGYIANGLSRTDRDQFSVKLDRRITDNNNFYASFAYNKRIGFDPFPSARNFYPGFGRDIDARLKTLALSDTHIFSPRVINEARFGIYDQNSGNLGENRGTDFNTVFGIPFPAGYNPGTALQGFPAIRIDGYSEFGDRPNDPFSYRIRNYQFYDSVSIALSKHNIKFGADILRSNYVEADVRNVRGDFRFRGRSTSTTTSSSGSTSSGFRSFGDFLLGLPDQTQLQFGSTPTNLTGYQYAFFIQDDWRVTPRLTLNLGLRYELQRPLREATGRLANFIPELATTVQSGDPRYPESLIETDKNNFGPRVGFALRPFDERTVIRGGAGIYYSLETFNPIRQQLAVTAPFIDRRQYSRSGSNPRTALTLANPFPGEGSAQGVNTPFGLQVDYEQPEFYQFNLTFEREIARDLAFEIGYVGSQGRHLGRRYNLNQSTPTGAVTTNSDGTFSPVNARPFPQFGDIQYQEQTANSSYNSLQTSLRRRSRGGLTLLTSYTFSRAIDNASSTNNSTTGTQRNPQNVFDFAAERGLADFHRKHQFSGSFNYELPFGRGRAFLADAGGLTQALLGGLQLNGIVTLLSGRPFTPQYASPDVGQQRPDIIGDPYANIPPGLLFNPAAFTEPVVTPSDPTFYGNAGRNILIGPSFKSFDVSLFKNVRLSENARLQLRAEAFNVFNHPNFQVPVFQLDRTNVGQVTTQANENRELQFAVKLLF